MQRNNSTKINHAKEMQSQEEFMNLMARRVEEENLLPIRPSTAHDLNVRNQKGRTAQTARTRIQTFKSKNSKDSPPKSVVLSSRKHQKVMSFNPAQ